VCSRCGSRSGSAVLRPACRGTRSTPSGGNAPGPLARAACSPSLSRGSPVLSHTGWRSGPRNGEKLPVPPPRQGSPDGSRVRWASLNRDQRSTGAWNSRGTRFRRWGHTRGTGVERAPRGVELSWNGHPGAWNSRGTRAHLPWNGLPAAWNSRGTRAEGQDRRVVELPWNCRAWGTLGRGIVVELPGVGRGTRVELAWNSCAGLQNSPTRKAVLLTRSFSGEWCGYGGCIYPLFLCVAPCSRPVTSTLHGPRWRRITRGCRSGRREARKETRPQALPDRHLSAQVALAVLWPWPIGRSWPGRRHITKSGQRPRPPGALAVERLSWPVPLERLSWPVPLGTSRWTSVSPRVPRCCPACCCPRFPVHRRQKRACARTPRPWWSSLTADARDAGSP